MRLRSTYNFPMHPETLAIHTARDPDEQTGAVAPALIMSTTFARDADYKPFGTHVYGRASNPNRAALEQVLAALEGGATAIALSSGLAAVNAIFQALGPGDHVIVPNDSYFGTRALGDAHFAHWGLQISKVDLTDLSELKQALRPNTKLVWVETPSNPQMRITDITRAAKLAHSVGAVCIVDNTFATPFCQQPLALGADVVMHSTTKFFGGHSDVTGGALIFKRIDALTERVRSVQALGGAVPSPFDCWLLLRSIPSMAYRMRGHVANAGAVAAFLAAHPQVAQVYYPGLKTHPGHAIAARQMRGGYGGMLSFDVAGGRTAALRTAQRVRLFTRATSLGGYESLIEHRATVEGAASVAPPALLRCSIGLEHADDLIADLDQALARPRAARARR
jgi:cystathionine gamma-synthase